MSRSPTAAWAWLVGASLTLLAGVGLAGESAAAPAPGGSGWWGFDLRPSSALVTGLLWAGYLLGGAGLIVGLRSVRQLPRWPVAGAALAVAGAGLIVAPFGSADHLSYAAYGRIKALGGDPYTQAPQTWPGGTDPVLAAAQPPWADTVSVYGPVGTALHTLASAAGGDSVRGTVWWWQLVCAGCYLLVAVLAHRMAAGSIERSRVVVAWTLNPLVIGVGLFGAHIDLVAVAFVLLAAWASVRHPAVAGAAAAAALSTKLPYGVAGLGLLLALRVHTGSRWRAFGWGTAGALAVLLPAHLWTGLHTYDQTLTATGYTSLASPWRSVVNLATLLQDAYGVHLPVAAQARSFVLALAPVLMVLAAAALWLLTSARASGMPARTVHADQGIVLRTVLVAGGGWVLATPYVLPWYDLMLWGPLAVLTFAPVAGSAQLWLAARCTVLCLAYVPGRVEGMSAEVERVSLAVRAVVAPAVLLVTGVALLVLAARSLSARRASRSAREAAPAPP